MYNSRKKESKNRKWVVILCTFISVGLFFGNLGSVDVLADQKETKGETVRIGYLGYDGFIEEANFDNLVKVFELLADEKNYPVYIHCWGGADRTGCVAFMIESILGLSEEKLMQNFELTCLSNMGNVKNRDDEDFAAMIDTLRKKGNTWRERMTNFLIECGVPMENIDKVRKIMLEK